MKLIRLYLLVCFSLILFGGCNSYEKPVGKKLIVCTTGYVADIARQICGDSVEIVSLMGPGVDPHLYKAGLRDVDLLTQADLIVYSGLHLEGKMAEILHKVGKWRPIICIADGLSKKDKISWDGAEGVDDPHFWFDPLLWKKGAQHFTRKYQQLKWGDSTLVNNRSLAYCRMLDDIHRYASERFNSLPDDKRWLVTPHDAFTYFSRAYRIKVKALQGVSTLSEYGLKDITELINFLVEKKINTVYLETSISPKATQTIIKSCQIKGHRLIVGGQLYSDALGDDGTPESTYKGVFLHNVNAIYNGLKQSL